MITCRINPLDGDKYLPVELNDGKPVVIGRSRETKIKTMGCSRHQLELIPNFTSKLVVVKQVGPNDSAVDGEVIGHGLYKVANDGSIIDILVGENCLKYKVSFEEKPAEDNRSQRQEDNNPKPVKIPKMFLPRSAQSKADEFRKDGTLSKGQWESIEADTLLVYTMGELEPKKIIYGFDLDGTLITTKSGRVFPKDDNDWKFLYSTTISKLQAVFGEKPDARFVIVTNQAGIGNGSTQVSSFKKKIETITRHISLPVVVFVITGKSEYRKPLPALWKLFVTKYNGGIQPDLDNSLYVGDAAGRKKDHSKVDRLFAMNVGIPFRTPEEFFMSQKSQEFSMPLFNPKKIIEQSKGNFSISNDHIAFSHKQEVIILVGFPGSGKSDFVKTVLAPKSYLHINRDTMKTAARCKSATESALQNGQSVVVDNTNPSIKDRAEYVQIAKKFGVPARCFLMKVDHAQALHNNRFRELVSDSHSRVPEVAFNSYKSRFQEPVMTEGFEDIVHVNFVPHFEDKRREMTYSLYLLEK